MLKRIGLWLRIHNKELSKVFELVLIAVIFFGLGALYVERGIGKGRIQIMELEKGYVIPSPISVSQLNSPAEEGNIVSAPAVQGAYVASRQGKTYYRVTCSNRIKEENKIYFTTEADARLVGLVPAKTCFQ